MYAEKLLPHDIEAEESVIGSLLIDGESILRVAPFLKEVDFYREKNRLCFQACLDLFHRSEAINQVTVAHQLALDERTEQVGGTAYLSHLVATVPTPVHIEHYGRIVSRTASMRRLIERRRSYLVDRIRGHRRRRRLPQPGRGHPVPGALGAAGSGLRPHPGGP